ncbi:MAG: GDSL-type esterase/lipase family protein [Rariglobus sp.]
MPPFRLVILASVQCLVVLCAPARDFAVQPRDNVVILGDSITSDGTFGQMMQDLIDEKFPDHRVRVLARGSHGDTARGAYARMELDVTRWRPDWVVLNFGVNDVGRFTTDEFLAHYERLINRVLRDTRASIVIASPIFQYRDVENPRMLEYVEGLRALAVKYQLAYAPVYEETKRLRSALPADARYAVDGTHPNEIGHWIFAQTILGALQFPFSLQTRIVEMPARRTVKDQGDALAGRRFTLDLPMPIEFVLTAPPPPEAEAVRAAKPVTIDGKFDEWNLGAPALALGTPEQRSWGVVSWQRDRHAAMAWFSWSEDALYFAIQVEDAQVRNDPETKNIVDRDCIELAIDARDAAALAQNPHVSLTKRIPQVAQYILAPTVGAVPASVVVGLGDKTMAEEVAVASTITSAGYQIEVRIPAARFAAGRLTKGDVIPVDVTTVNLDRGDRYLDNTSFRWTGSKWSAFNTREYGRLHLRD